MNETNLTRKKKPLWSYTRCGHRFRLTKPGDFDEELIALLREAHGVGGGGKKMR
jgi:hypothetical protein